MIQGIMRPNNMLITIAGDVTSLLKSVLVIFKIPNPQTPQKIRKPIYRFFMP